MLAAWSAVKSGWSSRLVRKYVDPPPAPTPSASIARSTTAGSQTSIRCTGLERTSGSRNAASIPMKWPTGVPVSVGRGFASPSS